MLFQNFTKFKRKQLCWSLKKVLKKAARRKVIDEKLRHRYFPVSFTTFLRTPNLNNFCKWLLTNLFHENKPPAPTQPTQRRRNDVVKTSSIWSQRRPRLIWNGSLDDSFFKTSSRRLSGDVLKTSSKRRPQDVFQETSLTVFPGDIFKTSSRRHP